MHDDQQSHSRKAMTLPVDAIAAALPLSERIEAAAGPLRAMLGERLSSRLADREERSHGEGVKDAGLPDLVVWPTSNEEVAAIARICTRYLVPMVPFGAGTSLEGQVAAVAGGVCIDLRKMDAVLEINQGSLDCRVQAGVHRLHLNHELRDTGLFFPLDPGADASIGGMAATRASGTNAVGYGTMRDAVLGLTVVTPDGRIVRTGTRARKFASGYDLTRLYIGSEGTLGIITEIQLRLSGLPEATNTAVCQFPSLDAAVKTASMALQTGLRVARMELLDEVQMEACISYSRLTGMAPSPTLLVEFHGTPLSVDEQAGLFRDLALDAGALDVRAVTGAEERSAIWKARHDAYHAVMALRPGSNNMGTDACVPIENLTACLLETQKDVRASGLLAPIVGHVGDGNFHLGILFDPADAQERERADALADRVGQRALRYGGTCSGEHGVGLHKSRYLPDEHGPALDLMRTVKGALDPLGLMNPGKMFPPADGDDDTGRKVSSPAG